LGINIYFKALSDNIVSGQCIHFLTHAVVVLFKFPGMVAKVERSFIK